MSERIHDEIKTALKRAAWALLPVGGLGLFLIQGFKETGGVGLWLGMLLLLPILSPFASESLLVLACLEFVWLFIMIFLLTRLYRILRAHRGRNAD